MRLQSFRFSGLSLDATPVAGEPTRGICRSLHQVRNPICGTTKEYQIRPTAKSGFAENVEVGELRWGAQGGDVRRET